MSFEASVPRHESRRDTLSAVLCARPGPRHEIINARGRPQIDQFGQNVLDVGLRINAVELARLDERGDASPIGCALVAAGEQRVLASKRDRTDRALDRIGVHLDAAVGDKAHEAIPMFEAIADCAGNDRFAGHAPEFAFEPRFKSIDERLTLCLTHCHALRGAAPTDPLLDCIERSNARERFLRDRRRTGFRDLIESSSPMRPAESECRGAAVAPAVEQLLVGCIAIALHDAAIACKQLDRVLRATAGRIVVGDRGRIIAAPRPVVTRHRPEVSDGEKEAKLIALACSKPPKGRARWTLRLLENKVVELGIVDRASVPGMQQRDRAVAGAGAVDQGWAADRGVLASHPPRA